MKIIFKRLPEVQRSEIMKLMTEPRLLKHMPLLSSKFSEADCDAFVSQKEADWAERGYGVWAFYIEGEFVGWGGLQYENGEPDLGLVLHPDHWGKGLELYHEICTKAFGEMSFEYITVLLPPSRTRLAALCRLGFRRDGEALIGEERFLRFCLTNERYRSLRPASFADNMTDARSFMKS